MNLANLSRRDFLIAATALSAVMRRGEAAENVPGSFENPFGPRSLWNARPVDPLLGNEPIPDTNTGYLAQTTYSTRMFKAGERDRTVVIYGNRAATGPFVGDEARNRNVIIPHFPDDVVPATGNDGHCEIFDSTSGILHSFFQLIFDSETRTWRASKYTASSINGTGWGTPASPDGPRAAGVSTAAGLLRAHEVGLEIVPHALAIAADANVFRTGPQFPATLEDFDGPKRYSGNFPMGTLFMLPTEFPIERLNWPQTRTIARTLQTFGARLVECTIRTLAFYGEIGGSWSQANLAGRWQSTWQADMTLIRESLRAVISTRGWLDANGHSFTPTPWEKMNLLSMGGLWSRHDGAPLPGSGYETTSRMFLFPESNQHITYRKAILLRKEKQPRPWFQWMQGHWYLNPSSGKRYRLRATGFGGASGGLQFLSPGSAKIQIAIDDLRVGHETIFETPTGDWEQTLIYVRKPAGPPAGIRLELEAI